MQMLSLVTATYAAIVAISWNPAYIIINQCVPVNARNIPRDPDNLGR